MSKYEDIARPYAKAAFEFAKEHHRVAEWAVMLQALASIVSDVKVQKALMSPAYSVQQTADLVRQFSTGLLDTHGDNFLSTVAANDRVLVLPEISRQYTLLQEADAHEIEATITTAFPLSQPLEEKLIHALEKKWNVKIHLHQEIDPALIGGARLRVGDEVTDASLLGHLQHLANYLHLKETL